MHPIAFRLVLISNVDFTKASFSESSELFGGPVSMRGSTISAKLSLSRLNSEVAELDLLCMRGNDQSSAPFFFRVLSSVVWGRTFQVGDSSGGSTLSRLPFQE